MPIVDVRIQDTRHQLKSTPQVFVYDHCPFCTKARMVFGFKNIKYEPRFLSNDDFDTPVAIIGKKAVPFLVMTHDNGEKVVMPESLDIIKYVDGHEGFHAGGPVIREAKKAGAIQEILNASSIMLPIITRFPKASTLPEFHSKEARATFIARHALQYNGKPISWDDAYSKDEELLKQVNEEFMPKISAVIEGPYVNGAEPSYDDIHLWALLRNMTIVKGFKYPENVRAYIDHVSQATDIPTYDAIAF